ncbi:MAG: MFS transporter [Pyrinomonadaceae bacterium]|nr:MFS transporter [Phycisphaerales bacterium]
MNRPAVKPWWHEPDANAWKALAAAGAGWMLDAMDVTLYLIALSAIAAEFHLDKAQSGAVASATLIASAIGGVLCGVLADRFGRVRMLMVSILFYSVCTALTATASNIWLLVFWRVLVGLGMGGEWSAGAVLVAETWPARHRGKAIGLMQSGWAIGYILAAALGALVLPIWGWRPLFVIGIAPALLVAWMRGNLSEPAIWKAQVGARHGLRATLAVMKRPPYLARAAIATATTACLLFAYWGLFSWVPTYLSSHDQGGAGLGVVKSAAWIVPMQIGAFFGYTSFGFLADHFGRRRTFVVFVLCAAAIVPIYGASARSETALMMLGPLVGFFGHGYFSVFGSMLAELFPSSVRGAAQGMCYNLGRGVSAMAPWVIGSIADQHGLGPALGLTSVLYVAGAGLVMLLPETRGKELE